MISKPKYHVQAEFGVRVEIHDGIELATDIYRPVNPSPAIRSGWISPHPIFLDTT